MGVGDTLSQQGQLRDMYQQNLEQAVRDDNKTLIDYYNEQLTRLAGDTPDETYMHEGK